MLKLRDPDDPPPKIVLCGNKSDLSSERQVTTEEGKKAAESMGCPFIETSAETRENVDEAFITLAHVYFGTENLNENVKDERKCIIC